MKNSPTLVSIIASILLGLPTQLVAAEPRLASLFQNHAVLQRDVAVPVWGWAEPHDEVSVEFANQRVITQADAEGKWAVKLASMKASAEPRVLVVRSKLTKKKLELNDVLVGDVWLCSGQSNMAVPVRNAVNGPEEARRADFPLIRLFQVPRVATSSLQPECGGAWQVCSPETVKGFSAVGYFFGRALHEEIDVPIGLIQSAWGSTGAEAWTSEATLAASEEFRPIIGQRFEPKREPAQNAGGEGDKGVPSGIYNGMIAPLVPYALRGAIWYQGENNANDARRAEAYRRLLPTMVEGWRQDFGREFPFYIVQLANFAKRGDSPMTQPWSTSLWSVLRESQAVAAATLPKSGLAVAIDIGDPEEIHPKNKQEVGRRLALVALAQEYGQAREYSGPVYLAVKFGDGAATVSFTHAAGLAAMGGGAVTGFLIAGEDGLFHPAAAEIQGATVRVSSPAVPTPVAVRYAWRGDPDCNLVNAAGLPAGPFRTSK